MSDWSDLYNRTVKTQRKTVSASTRSAAGSESWADSVTGIACAIQSLNSTEREAYGKVSPLATYKMLCDAGDDIVTGDRVVDEDSAEYEIVAIEDAGGRQELRRLILTRELED